MDSCECATHGSAPVCVKYRYSRRTDIEVATLQSRRLFDLTVSNIVVALALPINDIAMLNHAKLYDLGSIRLLIASPLWSAVQVA